MEQRADEPGIKEEELISGEITAEELAGKLGLRADTLAATPVGSVLILPDNSAADAVALGRVAFHENAKELMVVLKKSEIPTKLYDDGRPKEGIEWRSETVFLPTLYFAGKAICAGALGKLGAWIADKWLKAPEKEQPIIKAKWIVFEEGRVKEALSIEGPAKQISEFLRKRHGDDGSNSSRKRLGR